MHRASPALPTGQSPEALRAILSSLDNCAEFLVTPFKKRSAVQSEVIAQMSKGVQGILGIPGVAAALAADRANVVSVSDAEFIHVISHHAEREAKAQIQSAIVSHVAAAREVAATALGGQSGNKLETVFEKNQIEDFPALGEGFFRVEQGASSRSGARTVHGTGRARRRAHKHI